MNEETFVKGLSLLKEAFPNKTINAKIYFEALKDLSDDNFLTAVTMIVQTTTKLYPDDNLIAMIREKISGSLDDRSEIAWSVARAAILSHGYYKTICFQDRVINGAIAAMGGWEKFSSMLLEEEPFRKKDFIAIYEATARSGRKCPEKLPGNIERINGIEQKVHLIGVTEKPKEISSVAA